METVYRDFQSMKPIVDCMASRYSCRSFSDRAIEPEVLESILQAGLNAASGGNLQPISVIAVKDAQRKKELCALCEDQSFIEDAAINFVFCMDWHKYDVYTRFKKAPFVAHRSFAHFMIAMEDVMCMAQTVETAAFLYGIGSCYVGSVVNHIRAVSAFLQLPDKVFPVVMLSLGYPKHEPKNRIKKLSGEMIVCDEVYTDYSEAQICAAYDEKYEGRSLALSRNPESAVRMLETFRACLLTTYTQAETEEILAQVKETGRFDETQRRFGLHYRADEMLLTGREMQQDMKDRQMDILEQI